MKLFLKILAILTAVLYPVIIFVTLSYYDASPRVLSIVLVFVALVYFVAHTDKARGEFLKKIQFWGMILAAGGLAVITFITEDSGYVKFYPVSINLFLLMTFGMTLIRPPNMIFRIAQMQDKTVKASTGAEREKIELYCKKVTWIWISFFLFNGLTAVLTAIFATPFIWAFYNGLLSYILIGVIFIGELIFRKVVIKT